MITTRLAAANYVAAEPGSFYGGENVAIYKSKYIELSFYVNGELKEFKGGQYLTEDAAEIKVLDGLSDVEKVKEQAEAKPKTAAKTSKK